MRPVVVVLGSMLLSGCLGLGMRTELDDGDRGETAVQVNADLPGVTFAIGEDSVVLDGDVDAMVVAPAITGYRGTAHLSGGATVIELPYDLSADYATVGYDLEVQVTHITFVVVRSVADGSCGLITTNVRTEREYGWVADFPVPARCGPWAE